MKASDYIVSSIDRLPKGYIFTYVDFDVEVNNKEAVIKALNRMAAVGKIVKISKGKFYKPERTDFGALRPDIYQIVKDLLMDDGKPVGYLTGLSIYDKFGLTTQISNTIQIGRNNIRASFQRERYTISFIKQKNRITKENIPLLQILDVLKFIRSIPDVTADIACSRMMIVIEGLAEKDIARLTKLAMKYQPATRALLGAILDEIGMPEKTLALARSLNPITTYKIGSVSKVLRSFQRWNIL